MTNFVYQAQLLSERFNEDWSEVDSTYSTPEVILMSTSDRASTDEWGSVNGTGVYLFGPTGTYGLEFEPAQVQRLTWSGGVTDVLWIDGHVRAGDQVVGFDTFYIVLGGDALPTFGSVEAFNDFRFNDAQIGTPDDGLFRLTRDFKWAEADGLLKIEGDDGKNVLLGAHNDDVIWGYAGRDVLRGYAGNDEMRGGSHNDKMWGYEGDDTLYGDGGHDLMFGDDGTDRLYGGRANDTLDGGAGDDRLTGNVGADTFVFMAGYGRDRVLDMNVAEGDRIQLDDALWGGGKSIMEVFDAYATFSDGKVVLDFDGGERLYIYEGTTDGLVGLHGAIDII